MSIVVALYLQCVKGRGVYFGSEGKKMIKMITLAAAWVLCSGDLLWPMIAWVREDEGHAC